MSGPDCTPWILTVDIGSSSVRAVVRDCNARVLGGRGIGKSLATLKAGDDGRAVFNPKEVLEACNRAIDTALDSLGVEASNIAGVAIDSFGSSLLAVDGSGAPVSDVLCYADTRGSAQAGSWRKTLDETHEHDRTGVRLHASYWPAQLAFLLGENRELRKARFWPVGTWLMRQWFGAGGEMASLSAMSWTGLLDRRTKTYDPVWMERLGLCPEQLPGLNDFAHARQGLLETFSKRWPSLARVPWFSPVIDGAAANVGGGAHQPGTLAVTLGTTCAMRVVARGEPVKLPLGLWQYQVDANRPLVGGALTEGGGVFDWACRLTGIQPGTALEDAIKERRPGQGGLVLVPLLAGERAPGWNDAARGTLGGISLATTGMDVVLAAIEGVACRLARLFELMRPIVGENPKVIASGGLLASRAWQRALADAMGVEIHPCLEPEATGRGMALLALEALGVKMGWEPELGDVIEPNFERHLEYKELMQRQTGLEVKVNG